MTRDSFTVEADHEIHQSVLAARRAGRRQGGKLISCTMAFELGARILLGTEEKEEDAAKQEIEELMIQKAELEQKVKLKSDQLRLIEASRISKMDEAAEQNDNVQKLAQRIIEVWDNAVNYGKRNIIYSLVDIDRARLNKAKIEAAFPRIVTQRPSIDEAVKIAMDLLEGENIGA